MQFLHTGKEKYMFLNRLFFSLCLAFSGKWTFHIIFLHFPHCSSLVSFSYYPIFTLPFCQPRNLWGGSQIFLLNFNLLFGLSVTISDFPFMRWHWEKENSSFCPLKHIFVFKNRESQIKVEVNDQEKQTKLKHVPWLFCCWFCFWNEIGNEKRGKKLNLLCTKICGWIENSFFFFMEVEMVKMWKILVQGKGEEKLFDFPIDRHRVTRKTFPRSCSNFLHCKSKNISRMNECEVKSQMEGGEHITRISTWKISFWSSNLSRTISKSRSPHPSKFLNILHFFILNRFWFFDLAHVPTICNFDFQHLWNFMRIPKKKSSMNMRRRGMWERPSRHLILISHLTSHAISSDEFFLFKMKTVGIGDESRRRRTKTKKKTFFSAW